MEENNNVRRETRNFLAHLDDKEEKADSNDKKKRSSPWNMSNREYVDDNINTKTHEKAAGDKGEKERTKEMINISCENE